MNFVYATAEGSYELTVELDGADARIGDLARALGLADAVPPRVVDPAPGSSPGQVPGLFVDGFYRHAATPLRHAGMHEGAIVSANLLGSGQRPPQWDPGVYLSVLSGLDAGRSVPADPEVDYTIGRAPGCHLQLPDPTVSRHHCRLRINPEGTVTVSNESASVPTRVAGCPVTEPVIVPFGTPILLDTVAVVVSRLDGDDRLLGFGEDHGENGTSSLNRPPRPAATHPSPLTPAPEEPKELNKQPFNTATVLAPMAIGLVMVLVLGNPIYGVMAVASPVMAVGNWWQQRHDAGRHLRRSSRQYAKELEAFGVSVADARADELDRLRAAIPTLPEIVRRALLPSVRLWERRRWQDDFLLLDLGQADLPWEPLGQASPGTIPEGVAAVLSANGVLPDVPMPVRLAPYPVASSFTGSISTGSLLGGGRSPSSQEGGVPSGVWGDAPGGVLGIVGPRHWALGLARSLVCQASVLHGPADLSIVVAAADDPDRVWEWAKWLPHTRHAVGGGEARLVAVGARDANALFESLLDGSPEKETSGYEAFAAFGRGGQEREPATLFLVDGEELLAGRASPGRHLLSGGAGPAAGIVIAPSVERLPSLCDKVVTIEETGEANLVHIRQAGAPIALHIAALDARLARRIALALSRFDDPELHVVGGGLPGVIRLGAMLGVKEWTPEAVASRWKAAAGRRSEMRAAIGSSEDGLFELDLDRHGPHGLIGGTTGSGKSELLKTLVASLASSYPPDQLTFGLFDFKGGATFADFATLPHTVGMASDLDVSLAKRALRCLRAELLRRERVFEAAGVKDLVELNERQAMGDQLACSVEVLPRLVVIIDEFAAMAKELSEEIGALADLTARGRSLGVHLLLATQKPSTAINAEIRANTRLRISLQVEDQQDSVDVVGIPDAAKIDHKGRGYFRVGSSEVVPLQTAWSTSKTAVDGDNGLTVTAFPFAAHATPAPAPAAAGTTTELTALVGAITTAYADTGRPLPRRPWPDPLPDGLTLDELDELPKDPAVADDLYFALADDPDRQTRHPVGWPMGSGNLLFYGIVGSGTTTALATLAVAFARAASPERHQLYVLDGGAGDLMTLEALPHCGSVIRAGEEERQIRLFRVIGQELGRRRSLSAAERAACPVILLVIDNLEGLRAAYETESGPTWEQFLRIYNDGPEAGIYVAGSATRVNGLPSPLTATTPNKYILRLADSADYGSFGLTRITLPTFVPGRAIRITDRSVVQIALAGSRLANAVDALASSTPPGKVAPIRSLPDVVPADELTGVSKLLADRWDLAVGRSDEDLSVSVLSLYENEHVFVAGPARSGKSTALLTVTTSLLDADPRAEVYGFGGRRSPLLTSPLLRRATANPAEVGELIDLGLVAPGPALLLIDDAELFDDPGGRLAALLTGGPPNLHVAAAGKSDILRGMFGHWSQTVRRSRAGLLLQPALDRDGELLGARLPFKVQTSFPPGRGFLVCDGNATIVQTAS